MPKLVIWYNADGLRFCTHCRCYMGVEQFYRNHAAKTPDGLARRCKRCYRETRRDYYARHRTHEIAAATAWQSAHPERARATARRANRVYYRLRERTPAQVARMVERMAANV